MPEGEFQPSSRITTQVFPVKSVVLQDPFKIPLLVVLLPDGNSIAGGGFEPLRQRSRWDGVDALKSEAPLARFDRVGGSGRSGKADP